MGPERLKCSRRLNPADQYLGNECQMQDVSIPQPPAEALSSAVYPFRTVTLLPQPELRIGCIHRCTQFRVSIACIAAVRDRDVWKLNGMTAEAMA